MRFMPVRVTGLYRDAMGRFRSLSFPLHGRPPRLQSHAPPSAGLSPCWRRGVWRRRTSAGWGLLWRQLISNGAIEVAGTGLLGIA